MADGETKTIETAATALARRNEAHRAYDEAAARVAELAHVRALAHGTKRVVADAAYQAARGEMEIRRATFRAADALWRAALDAEGAPSPCSECGGVEDCAPWCTADRDDARYEAEHAAACAGVAGACGGL
jgi:hypothetical protein